VGYGEAKPKVVKRKLTEKYDWLKEGDQLTEQFINALNDEEKQDICHQLNRRTEFTVLRTTYGMFNAEEKPSAEKEEVKAPLEKKEEKVSVEKQEKKASEEKQEDKE
jgi:hypothetical protein